MGQFVLSTKKIKIGSICTIIRKKIKIGSICTISAEKRSELGQFVLSADKISEFGQIRSCLQNFTLQNNAFHSFLIF